MIMINPAFPNPALVVRQHLPGEREMYIEARFGGLEVTFGDEHEDVLRANMTGKCCNAFLITLYICVHTMIIFP